jgi:hypothetical protein
MNKRYEGDILLIKTYNATSDVVGLFAIAENIDSVVFALQNWIPPKRRLQKAIEQMNELPQKILQSSECFCQFEASPNHHPYRLHKSSLSNLSQQMVHASTSFLTRFDELPDSFTLDSQAADIKKHILESTIPTFSQVARKIRGLITPPQFYPDTMYGKTHAINEALKYRKGTPERGLLIKDMALMGCVPSKTAFYDAINAFEKEEGNVMIGRWNMVMRKGCLRKIPGIVAWMAHVYMPAIPVDCDSDGNPVLDKESILELYKTPSIIDISDYMGLPSDEYDSRRSIQVGVGFGGRIYFSPHQFPTPLNLDIAGSASDKVFQRLKKCIQKYCKDAGSPVVCNGGKVGSKKFVCSHKMRKGKHYTDKQYYPPGQPCKYSFTVKWDKLGYFIALRNRRNQSNCFIGRPCHNHE